MGRGSLPRVSDLWAGPADGVGSAPLWAVVHMGRVMVRVESGSGPGRVESAGPEGPGPGAGRRYPFRFLALWWPISRDVPCSGQQETPGSRAQSTRVPRGRAVGRGDHAGTVRAGECRRARNRSETPQGGPGVSLCGARRFEGRRGCGERVGYDARWCAKRRWPCATRSTAIWRCHGLGPAEPSRRQRAREAEVRT